MSFFNKFIFTSLITISLLGCTNSEQQSFNVDTSVKHNNTTLFESSIPLKEDTSYSKVEGDCKITLFLSRINDADIQLESELECNKGDLLLTPQFVVKEGSSATLDFGDKSSSYSYTVKVTKG